MQLIKCAAILSSYLAAAEIVEFEVETQPQDLMDQYEYAVIHFYDSSEHSTDTRNLFRLAHDRFLAHEEEGNISGRNIGWFSCDIEKHPELKIDEGDGAHVVVTHQSHMVRKTLDYVPSKDEDELAGQVNLFVDNVWELTGNWIPMADCEEIKDANWVGGETLWDLVYFGSEASLETIVDDGTLGANHQYEELILASMVERYEYHDEFHTAFHINTDPECAAQLGLDSSKSNLMLFVKDADYHSAPFVFTTEPGQFKMDEILTTLNVSLSRALPRWGRRAHTTLTNMDSHAIIFMVNDLNDPTAVAQDWRYHTFADIVTMLPSYDAGNMIPILTTLEPEYLGEAIIP